MTKYAVWELRKEDSTKQYFYANTHREAARKFCDATGTATSDVETQKVK